MSVGMWDEREALQRRSAAQAAEKIRAEVAEDQRVAREASGGTMVGRIGDWRPSPRGDEWEAHADGDDEELLVALRPDLPRPFEASPGYWGSIASVERYRDDESAMPQFRHAARHDPAHVLARSATILDVLADLEKIAERSPHPDPRMWARLAICELARAWDLDKLDSETAEEPS